MYRSQANVAELVLLKLFAESSVAREPTQNRVILTVLEVEIVSYTDRKTWFVFEVELDGETPISRGFRTEESSKI